MSEHKLLLAGSGGHCRSVLDSIDRSKYTDIVITTDLPETVGKSICGAPIVGTDKSVLMLYKQGYTQAVVAVGSIGDPQKRIAVYQLLKSTGFSFPVIIDPTAIVSSSGTAIEEGVFIGKGAIINIGVRVGKCCIINSGTIIDHDTQIGQFAHIGPGASVSGNVVIGDYSHIGTGSSIIQSISIGANSIVGAGSVVIRDITDGVVAFGNPCKASQKTEE